LAGIFEVRHEALAGCAGRGVEPNVEVVDFAAFAAGRRRSLRRIFLPVEASDNALDPG
jgi:hypothetical protein